MSRNHFTGWVYFIQADVPGLIEIGAAGPIKIGFTTAHPDTRVESLRTASPFPFLKLGVLPGTFGTEVKLRGMFESHRLNREWFESHPEITSFIAANVQPWPDAIRLDPPKPKLVKAIEKRLDLEPKDERIWKRNALWLHAVEVGLHDPITGIVRPHSTEEIASLWGVSRRIVQHAIASVRAESRETFISN